jgi:hypothetical protein
MDTIMNELKEFKNSEMGMYDSATGKTVRAKKVIDLITKRDFEGQAVVKYANVKRGLIAQICQWYEKGKDLGMTVHYHINEMTMESLAADCVFEPHAKMIGYKPIDLARIIYDNAPKEKLKLQTSAE